jgi:hypothetical protein
VTYPAHLALVAGYLGGNSVSYKQVGKGLFVVVNCPVMLQPGPAVSFCSSQPSTCLQSGLVSPVDAPLLIPISFARPLASTIPAYVQTFVMHCQHPRRTYLVDCACLLACRRCLSSCLLPSLKFFFPFSYVIMTVIMPAYRRCPFCLLRVSVFVHT